MYTFGILCMPPLWHCLFVLTFYGPVNLHPPPPPPPPPTLWHTVYAWRTVYAREITKCTYNTIPEIYFPFLILLHLLLPSRGTSNGLFSVFLQQMSSSMWTLPESFVTNMTSKWHFSCVQSGVSITWHFLVERFATEFTCKRFLSCMDSLMPETVAMATECSFAVFTNKHLYLTMSRSWK